MSQADIQRFHVGARLSETAVFNGIVYLAGMNEVWDAWVAPGHAPPRATVQATLGQPDWKIEVVVTAALA